MESALHLFAPKEWAVEAHRGTPLADWLTEFTLNGLELSPLSCIGELDRLSEKADARLQLPSA